VNEWYRRKMKVKLAVQVLSQSVADALQFLRDEGHPQFADAGATIVFFCSARAWLSWIAR
jgi:hypothetical protein